MVNGPKAIGPGRFTDRRRGARRLVAAAFMAILLGQLLVVLPAPASALTYRFSVPKEYVDVHIRKDGGIDIDYTIDFVNYADLDGVDIGLPSKYYDLGSARASITVQGASYAPSNIRASPYLEVGVAVEFGSGLRSMIENRPGGAPLSLYLHVSNPHMVYENEIVSGTVGIRFRPTWFGSSYQQGPVGELRSRIFFPPGFTDPAKAVWLQDRPWDNITLDNSSGLVVATWSALNVPPSSIEAGNLDVGAGLPAKYVDKYYKHDIWEALGEFLTTFAPCCVIAVIIAVIVVFAWTRSRKRARDYFEPELSVPGAGPRRDLTAVEAAIALERPMEMVATMILFGLVRKGAVEIIHDGYPMALRATGKPAEHAYEAAFLRSIGPDGAVIKHALRDGLIELVKDVQAKLKGFDYDATRNYYERICQKAWDEVKAAGTPEDFAAGLSQKNEWMMLDQGYPSRMGTIFVGMPPHYHTQPISTKSAGGMSPQQMAQRYVGQMKTSSANLVSEMKGLGAEVTKATHPVPVATYSGRGGGGGGCACACACACAGGGR
jgi:hypothetical protein